MTLDAIINACFSGGVAASIARLFISKSLRDLESLSDKMANVKTDLTAIVVRLQNHDKDRDMLLRHEKQLAVLENNVYKKGVSKMAVEEKFGIEETSEMVVFLAAVTQAGIDAAEDHKLSGSDAFFFWKAVQKAPEAFTGMTAIPSELFDLSTDEISELAVLVAGSLKIAIDPKVDALVKQVIKVVFEGFKIAPLVLALKK